MTEITLTGAAGAENGTELAQVLTQYASDYFDSFTYNTETEEVECKNSGDDTVWVKIKITSGAKFSTTLFNGWYASPTDSGLRQINAVYVFDNCVIVCHKRNSNSTIAIACVFCKNNLGEVCVFFVSVYNANSTIYSFSISSSETVSNSSMILLINTSDRSEIKIPIGDMLSHIQIVNAIPIYDSRNSKLQGLYFNTMGALKDMYEATQFQCNGNTYYSVIVGRFIVED